MNHFKSDNDFAVKFQSILPKRKVSNLVDNIKTNSMFESYNSQPDLSPQQRMSICKIPTLRCDVWQLQRVWLLFTGESSTRAEECPKGKW